jgi:RNA polymerase sigma-70 factor (ECF subfamily)
MRLFRQTKYGKLSDEALMEHVGRGEVSAFDVLYDRYAKRLLRYFTRMLGGDVDMSQDMLHDLFLKIVERPQLYTSGRSFSTWVFSIASNMCKNEYRRRTTHRIEQSDIDFDSFAAAAVGVHEILDHGEFARLLAAELETFDEDLRATFLLRHQEEFSIREISEVLGCPEGTVKSRLFNTARRLSERLQNYNPNIRDIHHEQA